jgi:type I restriction enzyme M protein
MKQKDEKLINRHVVNQTVKLETGEASRHYAKFDSSHIDFLKLYCKYLYALQLQKGTASINLSSIDSYKEFLDQAVLAGGTTEDIADLALQTLANCDWDSSDVDCLNENAEDLKHKLLSEKVHKGAFREEYTTPSFINALAIELLDIQENDRVADFGCGEGSFLLQAAQESNEHATYSGMEINQEVAVVAMIRASLADATVEVELGNMFDDKYTYGVYDKVFSNYPLRIRPELISGNSSYLARVKVGLPEYGRPSSADWVFNRLIFDALKENGRAVGIMTNGSACNGMDRKIRRYFVDNGMIEGIIALPENLLSQTASPLCMVVLSYNNDGIMFVGATKEFEKGRRQNSLSSENVQKIAQGFFKESEISHYVTNRKVRKNDYDLLPTRYTQEEIIVENGVPFGELIVSITRGSSIKASELDALTTKKETPWQFLMLQDVVDGRISTQLPFLKSLDPKLEKYCIKTGDLLLSKNGAPYKVAVASVPEGKTILANGNLYIIKLDTEKVDPSYVAAFFQGKTGKAVLDRASVGSTIPNISLSNLKNIKIPMKPLEDQRQIGAKFEARLDAIEALKLQLEQARQAAFTIFDKEA